MKLEMLDVSIIVIYLIMCLIIGFYRSARIKTLKQFALGYQSLSTTMLVCVIFASTIGGGTMLGSTERIYQYGVAFIVGLMFLPLSWLISARLYGSNIERFKGCTSISHIMHHIYGPSGRWVTSFTAIINGLGTVAAQAIAIGYIFHYFFGIESIYGMLISFSILVLYTSLGGIRAVVLTEVFQFSIFFFIIPVSYVIAMSGVDGMQGLMQKLPTTHCDFELTTKNVFLFISFVLYSIIPASDSTLIQRYLMASGATQLKKSLITIAWIYIPFSLSLCLIAYIVQAQAPGIPANNAFLFYIDNYLPIGLKGLMVAGIMAAIMNVAEAWLNSTSVILVNDVIKVLFPAMSHNKQLLALRVCVVVLAIISLFIAYFYSDVGNLILLVDNFWTPLLIPIMSGFLGFRTSGNTFIFSVLMAIVFIVSGRLIAGKFGIISFSLGILGSVIGLFGKHYWQSSYKIVARRKKELLNRWLWGKVFEIRGSVVLTAGSIMKFLRTPSRDNLSQKTARYQKSAIYILIYYFTYTFYLTADPAHKLLSYLLVVGYFLCFILLLRDIIFSRSFQTQYLFLYWYCTLTFCLPTVASYMLFASKGNDFWIINGLLTAFSLCLFVDAVTFIILLFIGVGIGYGLFLLSSLGSKGLEARSTLGNIEYVYLLFLFIFLVFFRNKEREQEEKIETMQMLGGAIAHEVKTPLSGLIMSAQAISAIMNKVKAKKQSRKKYVVIFDQDEYSLFMQINKSIEKIGKQGVTTVDSILVALKKSVVGDKKKLYTIRECIEQAIAEYSILNDDVKNIEISIQNNFKVNCSIHYLKHAFFNLIKNAFKYGGQNVKIKIWTKGYTLHFKDYGKGVAREDLPYIFDRFYTKSKTGTGIGLAFCKMVIEDLGGRIECKSKLGRYTEFTLKFPKLSR